MRASSHSRRLIFPCNLFWPFYYISFLKSLGLETEPPQNAMKMISKLDMMRVQLENSLKKENIKIIGKNEGKVYIPSPYDSLRLQIDSK